MTVAGTEAPKRPLPRSEGEKWSWLRSLQGLEYRRALFAFEMLLKALDRTFNLDNHPRFQREPPTPDCDFKVEVAIVNHTLRELIQLSQAILDDADTSAFMFQSYVETELLSDLARDELLERYRRQTTPLESLYLLRVGLESLANVTAAVSLADRISLATFRGLGHQYVSILLHNRYFSPYGGRTFNPLYDRVQQPLLRRAVHAAPSRPMRRGLSLFILALGRYLRVVGWLDPRATSRIKVQSALPTSPICAASSAPSSRSWRMSSPVSCSRKGPPAGPRRSSPPSSTLSPSSCRASRARSSSSSSPASPATTPRSSSPASSPRTASSPPSSSSRWSARSSSSSPRSRGRTSTPTSPAAASRRSSCARTCGPSTSSSGS